MSRAGGEELVTDLQVSVCKRGWSDPEPHWGHGFSVLTSIEYVNT